MLEGEYLTCADAGKYILIGKDVLAKYSVVADVDATALPRGCRAGTKVRVNIGTTNKSIE